MATGEIVIREAGDEKDAVRVVCQQIASPIVFPPRPRYQVVDMPGRTGVNEYMGQDPYMIVLTVRIGDDYPRRNVEPTIEKLQGFAEVHGAQTEPPALVLEGAVPRPQPNIKWQLTDIAEPFEQDYTSTGKNRTRYATKLTFTQQAEADKLNATLRATKKSQKIRTRKTKVRAGERDLYAVARRYYGDPSRASDISRANPTKSGPLPLGTTLKPGTTLKMPS